MAQKVNPILVRLIGKLLRLRCLKWARMTHLGAYNISYGQKKGRESKCQFDSRPLKVRNHPNLLACRWHVRYCWKSLDKGYNFSLNLTSIEGLYKKLWASKHMGVLNFGNFETPKLGVLRQNDIWVQALWPSTKNNIRGKVVASPKFRPWWVLWVCVCTWLIRAPKMLQLRTNQLVVWFV